MPESPDTDLEAIKQEAQGIARDEGAIGEMQIKVEPIAFVPESGPYFSYV